MSASPPPTMPPVPAAPGGLIRLPPDSILVEDADEEIMELYMNLKSTTGGSDSGGLGYLDATAAELQLSFELTPPAAATSPTSPTAPTARHGHKHHHHHRAKGANKARKNIAVDLTVIQDPNALRARVGDTGSVLWRSSLHLARHLLTQHHFPPPPPSTPLLDPTALSTAHIFELGAGTGVLAALLAPLCAKYTATDRQENVKLVQRNIDANAKGVTGAKKGAVAASVAQVEVLDWVDVAALASRAQSRGATYAAPEARGVDLVLAVDCIYNESLVGPLVAALRAACARGAVAWVVVELRSPDVLTVFLDTWLNDAANWTIVRLGDDAMGAWDGEPGRWVGWVGWCDQVQEDD